jgi:hypothetical protein
VVIAINGRLNRVLQTGRILLNCCLLLFSVQCRAAFSVTATKTELIFKFDAKDKARMVAEVQPWEDAWEGPTGTNTLAVFGGEGKKFSVPRFDGERDRIYSGFQALENEAPAGGIRFVEVSKEISKYRDAYPRTSSKKGLQVQMVDDAIKLGVKQAAFNFDLGGAVKPVPTGADLRWDMDGREFWFDSNYIRAIDREVKSMSDTGAAVTLILLNYVHPGSAADAILRHPHYDPKSPEHLSAFNTCTPPGMAWFKACVEFLAERYSEPGYPHGRVVNYIVGNEVNTHWYWDNMGHVSMEEFARDYSRAVRTCVTAVRKFSSSDRVFISLEHHWNIRYAGVDDTEGFRGRPFVDYLNRLGKEQGDFDWNVAFHPYPENLFDCRTWLDKTATYRDDTPRITFRNIEMLPRYLRRREMLYHGEPRRIILSEQGFHSKPTAEGEKLQAAAYCYAWRKIVNLAGVDAFILHRHVDYHGEGGLNLGLWRRDPKSTAPSQPLSRKPIYEVFRLADTPQWKQAFAFALPVIGIKSWSEIKDR